MLSMPPATTYLKSPQRRSLAAIIAARMPEPQTLLRVMAPVATGQPAAIAAWRAGACPWPAVRTHPMLTCWISSGVRPARSMAAAIARAPRACAGRLDERTLEGSDRGAHRAQDNDVVHDLSCKTLGGSCWPLRGLRTGTAILAHDFPGGSRPAIDNGTMRPGMRFLGIDFGEKRIGLAISDPDGRLAVPLSTLERRNDRSALRQIAEIARQEGIERLVLGEPVDLYGRRGEIAGRARRFGARLAEMTGLPVEWVDETLTSVEAAGRLRQAGVDTRREPGRIDAVAAQILLQDALDRDARG